MVQNLYLREKFDSVAVSESITSSMTNLSSTGLPVLLPNISPDFLACEDNLSSMFHSELFDELAPKMGLSTCLLHTQMSSEVRSLSDLVPRLSDAVETSTFGSLTLHRDTKLIINSHRFKIVDGTEIADVEQKTLMTTPFTTCETSLRKYVCELVLVCDLDLELNL